PNSTHLPYRTLFRSVPDRRGVGPAPARRRRGCLDDPSGRPVAHRGLVGPPRRLGAAAMTATAALQAGRALTEALMLDTCVMATADRKSTRLNSSHVK